MTLRLLQDVLDAGAAMDPHRVAVRDGQRTMTYAELREASARAADALAASGVTAGMVVGIALEKSIDAIVAAFGVLYLGAAYAPLDVTTAPIARAVAILDRDQITHVVSDVLSPEQIDAARNGHGGGNGNGSASGVTLTVIPTARLRAPVQAMQSAAARWRVSPAIDVDLAYLLYTSGSTGTPKGVMISHRNALTFVSWALSYFAPRPGAIFASHAPLHFDLSIFDIFVALASGGTVSLVPASIGWQPKALLDWMSREGINYWYSVPSVWVLALNYANLARYDLSRLERVLFAGEVFEPKYLQRLMTLLPHAGFYNLYGPTETNVCTCHHVASASDVGDRPVPIGAACENTEVILLGDDLRVIDDMEPGELCVRGSGVTRGYYRNPARSAQAFVVSPLARHQGDLLYRTGDLVKRNQAGLLEYIGRKDSMVKVGGFRIELEEVEHAMERHPGVERAVAVAYHDDTLGMTRLGALIAWLPSASDDDATRTREADARSMQLKIFLGDTLPSYMVPDAMFTVDRVPQNANGKRDRVASAQHFGGLRTAAGARG